MDVSNKTVLETIDTAKEYIVKLKEWLCLVQDAENQVKTTAQKTVKQIEINFDLITHTLVETLEKRKVELIKQALTHQTDGLKPLTECRNVIEDKLRKTKAYVEEGEKVLQSGDREKSARFIEEATELGSLPAVPNLEEVVDVSFRCPVDTLLTDLQCMMADIGIVSKMGPVQLTDLQEKPGSLLVQWDEVDSERPVDVHSFRLQLAYGDVRGQEHLIASNFHDSYVGPETQYLVRDLRPGVPYTFRVCCRIEGDSDWSAWSLPRVAVTNQEPFYLTDTDITAQAMIFFLAGFETTAVLISFALIILAMHKDVQERLQEEIDQSLETTGGSMTYEGINNMKYLDMVISEILRLYPPAPVVERECVKPYLIPATKNTPEIHLNPKDRIFIPIYGFQHDPQYFPDPEKFDPERFSDENKHTIQPFTYFPFGIGPRSCIGNRFALLEDKIAIAFMLSRFSLHLTDKSPEAPLKLSASSFQMIPVKGFTIGLKKREKNY